MLLSQDKIQEFEENGYLVIEDVFKKQDLETFKKTLDRIVRALLDRAIGLHRVIPQIAAGNELSEGVLALESLSHDYISDLSDFIAWTPEIMRLSSTPILYKAALELMNTDTEAPVYITNCGVVLAMPHDRNYSYGWHKDTYYTLPYSNYIQLWAPLIEDATESLGTLQVVRKSHLTGMGDQHAVNGVPNRHRYRVNAETLDNLQTDTIELGLGQALLFHSGLAHRSGVNKEVRPRFSLVSVYHQIENHKIRPIIYTGSYKGISMDEYFSENCGDYRHPDDKSHFSK